jgi:3-oxoacyl-[acyl-carrier protein] reductase
MRQDEGMDLGLTNRVYLVTGGSRGLGLATAHALVSEGARVVIAARDEDRVNAAVADLGGNQHAFGLSADLTDPSVAERWPSPYSDVSTALWLVRADRCPVVR